MIRAGCFRLITAGRIVMSAVLPGAGPRPRRAGPSRRLPRPRRPGSRGS